MWVAPTFLDTEWTTLDLKGGEGVRPKITLLKDYIRALVNMRIKEIGRGKGVRIIQADNIPKAVEKLGLRFDGKNYYDQDGNIVLFVKSEFKIME